MIFIFFIFGLAVGSFLNVVIYRLTQRRSFSISRSFCPHCQKTLAWYELIPLISFVIQRRQCRHCHKKISWQYPLVELTTGLLFVAAYQLVINGIGLWHSPENPNLILLRNLIFLSALAVIFVIDLRYYLILDKITLPVIIFAMSINLFLGITLWHLLLSAIIGGGFFLLQFAVSRGRWIGGGDIRLGILMGLMLAWPHILTALFLAYILGALTAVILVVAGRKKWSSQLPFGTFLTFSTAVTLFFGPQLVDWYLRLIQI
jgi:prepilin signal peptidase PulO-like enzyme (type II secretory pathway)